MPSSYTARLRLEMQAAGENLNTWGAPKLNNVINRLDFSIAGWTTIALTADYALTSSNSDDEARSASLKFTGAGPFAVTIPNVAKQYFIWNATSTALTIATGAGTTQVLEAGERNLVVCDGSNVTGLGYSTFSWKSYVDSVAWSYNAGNLPAQAGAAGKFLKTNGATPTWAAPATTDISDYASDQAAKRTTATGLAVALAIVL